MRRLIITLCTLIMTLSIALSGCSCSNTSPLSFNTDFAGGGANTTDLPASYKEVSTYTVSYNPSYNASLKLDDSLEGKIELDYNGTFVTEFQGDIVTLPDSVSTDLNYEGDIHYMKTMLDLNVKVNGKEYHDQIFSEVYFYSASQAFQPIYSNVVQKNTYISVSAEDSLINSMQNIYNYQIRYNKENFVCTSKYYKAESEDHEIAQAEIAAVDIYSIDQTKLATLKEDVTTEYTSKQAIDNVELLFAIRNVTIKAEANYTLPTVSPSYTEPKSLTINNASESTVSIPSIKYNGTTYENVTVPVKNLTFVIGGTKNVGTPQNVTVQKAQSETFPHFNALLIEYAESLSEIGSFSPLGALVYKLNSVEVIGLN